MNTYLIIGLIVILVGVLVYSRRRRSGDESDATTAVAAPIPAPPAPSPAAQASPLPRPAAVQELTPAAAAPPPPSNWVPEETIVEPGWPLPGEISGTWSPVTTETGAVAAVRSEPPAATAVVDPVPEAAPATADEWLMPPSPASWPAGAPDPAPAAPPPLAGVVDEAAPAEAFAVEAAATTWDPPVSVMDTPVWTPVAAEDPLPPADPAPLAWPLEEPAAAEPEPVQEPEPLPAPVAAMPADAPVAWEVDVHHAPDDAAPATAAAEMPAPVEWIAPEAEAVATPAPGPVVAPDPEPATVLEFPPAPADPEPADPASLAAELTPLFEGLLPLTRVSDRAGITPRMLAVMRILAQEPLSVTEQARRLEVSRPVVADLCARLEAQGLAQRERDAADRRRVRIVLTERGRRVCEEAPAADPDAVAAVLARLAPSERDDLARGVRALARAASTS